MKGWWWVGLLAVIGAVAWAGLRWRPDGRLHVTFFDVGQGDAIFVVTPDGRQLLVDGGPSPTALLNELGALMPFWDRDLDLVVLTHPDADHMTGLIPLLDRYRVGQVVESCLEGGTALAAPWRERLAAQRIPRTCASRGMHMTVGDLLITVLNPGAAEARAADDNDNSLVLRLDYGSTSLLLAGDVEAEAEGEMLAAGQPLAAQVLKVAHHGSGRSTSAVFLAAVRPQVAVIQVGADNDYGHPHADLLDRLAGIEVLRTDRNGRIEVVGDGRRLWVTRGR